MVLMAQRTVHGWDAEEAGGGKSPEASPRKEILLPSGGSFKAKWSASAASLSVFSGRQSANAIAIATAWSAVCWSLTGSARWVGNMPPDLFETKKG
jgi:hypothetical protein